MPACALASCGVCSNKAGACADLPAPGTNDVYRVCTPFPFEANLTVAAAQRDMELHIDDFEAFAYFSPGASRASSERVLIAAMCSNRAACLQHRAARW